MPNSCIRLMISSKSRLLFRPNCSYVVFSISRPRSSGIAVRTVQGRGHAQCGFIELALDPQGGRSRIAMLTPSGSAIHDQIREAAMESERAFMSALAPADAQARGGGGGGGGGGGVLSGGPGGGGGQIFFLNLLRRLHENLPAVEV